MRRPQSMATRILEMLADVPGGLTLGQVQQALDGYHELAALSACMAKLERACLVAADLTERTTERGRRRVKRYRLRERTATR